MNGPTLVLSRSLREERRRRRREGGRGSAVCGEIQISTERCVCAVHAPRKTGSDRGGGEGGEGGPVPYPLRANSWPIRQATAGGQVGPVRHAARSSGGIANPRICLLTDPRKMGLECLSLRGCVTDLEEKAGSFLDQSSILWEGTLER